MTKHYADVKAKPDFVEVEKEVLRFWEEDKTFENPYVIVTVPPSSYSMTALLLPTARLTTAI